MKRYFVAEMIGHVRASHAPALVTSLLRAGSRCDASSVAAIPSSIPGIVAIYTSDAWSHSQDWAEMIASASHGLVATCTHVLTQWPNDVDGWSRTTLPGGDVVHLSRHLAVMAEAILPALGDRRIA